MLLSKDQLSNKYWIEDGNTRFEYYPLEAKIVCFSDGAVLKAVHLVGKVGFEVDWTSFKGRSFLIKHTPKDTWKMFYKRLCTLATSMQCQEKIDKENLLENNRDNNTGKSLNYGTLIKSMFDLGKKYEAKKIRREDIAKFFNRYNIEDDEERIVRGADLMVLQKSKAASTAIREGKEALIRLFRKGKLIKLTKEEYIAKMERYGKEP